MNLQKLLFRPSQTGVHSKDRWPAAPKFATQNSKDMNFELVEECIPAGRTSEGRTPRNICQTSLTSWPEWSPQRWMAPSSMYDIPWSSPLASMRLLDQVNLLKNGRWRLFWCVTRKKRIIKRSVQLLLWLPLMLDVFVCLFWSYGI